MNNHQADKKDSYSRIELVETEISEDTQNIEGYSDEVDDTTTAVNKIEEYNEVQKADSGDLSGEAETAKKNMGKVVRKYCLRGAVKARRLGNHKLAEQLTHPKTYFTKGRKTECIQRSKDMRDLLQANLPTLVNIHAADITAIDAVITVYNNLQQTPIHDIQDKKAGGTDLLAEQFRLADLAIQNRYDLIESYLEDTKPEILNKFAEAMQVIHTGGHHTMVNVLCNDADSTEEDKSLEGVLFKIVELNLTATSNSFGMVGIAKFKPGNYHIEFTKTGYKKVKMIVNFQKGKITNLEIDMHRLA